MWSSSSTYEILSSLMLKYQWEGFYRGQTKRIRALLELVLEEEKNEMRDFL